jgi:hypothetical protein
MARTVVLRGHVVGPKAVELDAPAPPEAREAEVLLRVPEPAPAKKLSEVLRQLPPGTRSAADIQQQIEEERGSWGDE